MKQLLFFIVLTPLISFSQNTGIGTTTPTEKLDVNGNINVTGTIKANGVDGTANQVLMKNSSGVFTWGDMCEYKNYQIFRFTTSGATQNFTIPAGVTKIKAQVWGGGGKGTTVGGANTAGAGGGGGGYVEGYFTVTPGSSASITVGSGANSSISFSESSRIDYGIQGIVALGGGNASYNAGLNEVNAGNGGTFVVFSTTNYIGLNGEGGKPSLVRYDAVSSTAFAIAVQHGDGGNAANTSLTCGKGGFTLTNTSTSAVLSATRGTNGVFPGGGASADASSNSGAHGVVIVYY